MTWGMIHDWGSVVLLDIGFVQVLKECSENPGAANKHMRNPGIGAKMRKLMTAGIIRVS